MEKRIKDFEPKKQTINEMIKQMKETAFNARKLADSVDIVEEMIKEDGCVKFLALSGAMVPAGMRKCIVEMIKNGWVDIIVSTGANITHDLSVSLAGEHYIQCDPLSANDSELAKKKISRIYDVLSPDKTFVDFEKNIQKILSEIGEGTYSSYELLEKIGKKIDDKQSIVKAAVDNGVKIIIPAFFDSILGLQVWMFSQDKKFFIDENKDLNYLINLHYKLKEENKNSGVLIIGGGVPKNYTLQAVLIPEKPHRYVVQITTDNPHYGGLSGATLEEAKSWQKVNDESKLATVYCDATIAFPIIVSSLKERL